MRLGAEEEVVRANAKDKRERKMACEMVSRRAPTLRLEGKGERYRRMLTSGERKEVVDTTQALLGFLRNVGVGLDKVSRADVVEGGESEVEQRNNRLDFKSILQRYLMFQRLRKENPHLMLIPTADIEYAWICHVLRTEQYWVDCVREGIPIAHSLMPLRNADALMYVEAARATSLLWRKRFGGVEVSTSAVATSASSNDTSQPPADAATGQCNAPDLTFSSVYLPPKDEERCFQHQFYSFSGLSGKVTFNAPNCYINAFGPPPAVPAKPFTFESLIDINISLTEEDLRADMKWLPSFEKSYASLRADCWWSCDDSSEKILTYLMYTYDRYLFLVKKYPGEMLAPGLAADLLWHAHQLDPVAYKQTCLRSLGFELKHRMWGQNNDLASKSNDDSTATTLGSIPSEATFSSPPLSPGHTATIRDSDAVQRLWLQEFGMLHTEDHRYYPRYNDDIGLVELDLGIDFGEFKLED
jgi:hypothetical protein